MKKDFHSQALKIPQPEPPKPCYPYIGVQGIREGFMPRRGKASHAHVFGFSIWPALNNRRTPDESTILNFNIMTKTELKQKLLFACMQNPSLANDENIKSADDYKETPWPEHARRAIFVALDTAEYIYENLAEEFDIDPEPE